MSTYLKVDWKSGQFAEYSKEEKQGFEAYSLKNGETRFKKLYKDGLTASLQSVELKQSDYGLQLIVAFKDGDEWLNLQIPVLDQRDQITTYAVEIGRFLPNLVKGETYRVYPYLIEKDEDNKYEKRGISFKVGDIDGDKVAPALSWMADAEDGVRIPRLDWKEDALTGKKKPTALSVETQKDFFAGIFQREITRIEGAKAVEPTLVTPKDKSFGPPADTKETIKPEENDDDLPF